MNDPFEHCAALVRAADRDRFLASLFAPSAHRPGLFALYAFNLEIARVRALVSDPLAGEIRLQWWADVIAGGGRGEVAANPVAAALLAAKARCGLPEDLLAAPIAARRFDLYDEPMASLADLETYGLQTAGALFELAARILEPGAQGGVRPLTHHAGLGYAIGGILAALPSHAGGGQLYVPLDILARHPGARDAVGARVAAPALHAALNELRQRARHHLDAAGALVAAAPSAIMPALLPAALTRLWLDRMDQPGYDPFVPIDTAPWRRQWRLWRAARQPRRMFG
jgi:phytoene synthase